MLEGSLYNSTNTPQCLCIHALLVEQAERTPDAPAILVSGRAPLTYGRLWRHVDEVVQALRAMGISRQDRVALILPNGAEMAVAFLDEAGDVLPVGATGEVVVRGASIMQSYDDAAANQNTFTQGWFRTGDQGYMDADGYLFITGRIKEAINRGGEKITPQEVDDVLLDHPAVAQAVTFAMPHTLQFAGSGASTWGSPGGRPGVESASHRQAPRSPAHDVC